MNHQIILFIQHFVKDPDDVNNIAFRDLSFVLFNQKDQAFVVNDFSAVIK